MRTLPLPAAGALCLLAACTGTPDAQPLAATPELRATAMDPLDATITGPNRIPGNGEGTWTVTASGGTWPYSYQWYVDNVAAVGETGTSFTYGDYGNFVVKAVVTDASSATTSVQRLVYGYP
jgi:hypothetical protein